MKIGGLFITFEGGEGAGKTTLIEEVARFLEQKGCSFIRTREPGGTPLGEEIRQLLLKPRESPVSPYAELCLFLASRAQHLGQLIRPALSQNKIVLCDRFNDSTIAYQGIARGLGLEAVEEFCRFICGPTQPDLTLYLDIDPSLGLERASRARTQDRIEQETLSFHQKIREGFHKLHRSHPDRLHLLDASQSKEKVLNDALQLIEAKLAHV